MSSLKASSNGSPFFVIQPHNGQPETMKKLISRLGFATSRIELSNRCATTKPKRAKVNATQPLQFVIRYQYVWCDFYK